MADGSAWFALAGALGGVALTGVIGLVTAALTHRWSEQARTEVDRKELTRVMRNQRREACHAFLVATNSFWDALDKLYQRASRGEKVDSFEHLRAANTVMQNTYVDLTITCGAKVRRLADYYHAKLYELRPAAQAAEEDNWTSLNEIQRQARAELRDAMRAELGVLD